jgi:predicted dehydrogenase
MTEEKQIGIGVVGLGFMGRTHLAAYERAAEAGFANRLVAVSDIDEKLAGGRAGSGGNLETGQTEEHLFDPDATSFHLDPAELFALEEVDLVSICTHTLSHVDLAIAALEAGKHVLLEKPVALTSPEVARLADFARDRDRFCMPAMCIRFWSGWDWLQEAIAAGTYGKVRSAVFRRLVSHPAWSPFYADPAQNGGALFDVHVHDADFIRWCFGPPVAVRSTGGIDHLTTFYRYPDGPAHVVAEAAWDLSPGFEFEMNFTVLFEEATADYRVGRTPQLQLLRNGEAETIEIPDLNGYDGEVRHLLAAIARSDAALGANLDDAVGLTKMLEAEQRSLLADVLVKL